jgi:hypothetical protein
VRAGGPESGSFGDGLSQPEERNEAAMADEDKTVPLSNVITIDDERIRGIWTGWFAGRSRRR